MRLLIKSAVLSCLLALTHPSFADNQQPITDNCVNQVTMNYSAETWLDTQTSLVTVNMTASVPVKQVDPVTQQVKTKLAQLSGQTKWRLVNLTRNESASGLISLSAQAVARLDNQAINQLQQGINTLNKPGEKYEIANIDHQADLANLNQTKAELRSQLYQQIINGLTTLNRSLQSYSAQATYHIQKINFNPIEMNSVNNSNKRVLLYTANARANNQQTDNSTVSGKITLSADVTYGGILPACLNNK